jgi:hypothetical protein
VVIVGVILATGSKLTASQPTASQPTASQLTESQLKAGDCLTGSNLQLNTSAPWPTTVEAVPCGRKHIGEVYYSSNYWAAAAAYPGDQAISDQYSAECTKALKAYTTASDQYTGAVPTAASWQSGDRQLVCVAYNPTSEYPGGAPLYASIKAK